MKEPKATHNTYTIPAIQEHSRQLSSYMIAPKSTQHIKAPKATCFMRTPKVNQPYEYTQLEHQFHQLYKMQHSTQDKQRYENTQGNLQYENAQSNLPYQSTSNMLNESTPGYSPYENNPMSTYHLPHYFWSTQHITQNNPLYETRP